MTQVFRAKRKDTGEWVTGELITDLLLKNIKYIATKGVSAYELCCPKCGYSEPERIFYEVIPETICSYSGIDDSYEQKIFENDILDYWVEDGKRAKAIVQYGYFKDVDCGYDYIGWYLQIGEENVSAAILEYDVCSEVVGNVYDEDYKKE